MCPLNLEPVPNTEIKTMSKRVFIQLPSQAIPRKLDLTLDMPETRVTGVHHTWPVDPDTTKRLERLRHTEPRKSERQQRALLVAVVCFVIVAYGAFLLWVSK